MSVADSAEATAREVVAYAAQNDVDLGPVLNDIIFQKDSRWVFFWQKDSAVHYNMQGRIASRPAAFAGPSGAFPGMWGESGAVESIGDAYALVKAWLLDAVEVDNLPQRRVLRHGIG